METGQWTPHCQLHTRWRTHTFVSQTQVNNQKNEKMKSNGVRSEITNCSTELKCLETSPVKAARGRNKLTINVKVNVTENRQWNGRNEAAPCEGEFNLHFSENWIFFF